MSNHPNSMIEGEGKQYKYVATDADELIIEILRYLENQKNIFYSQ